MQSLCYQLIDISTNFNVHYIEVNLSICKQNELSAITIEVVR